MTFNSIQINLIKFNLIHICIQNSNAIKITTMNVVCVYEFETNNGHNTYDFTG